MSRRDTVAELADIELERDTGETTPLGRLWQDQAVLLVFLRHFG